MVPSLSLLLVAYANLVDLTHSQDGFEVGEFPSDFQWGVATSAYQIEGGWNASGKGMSIWDKFSLEGKLNDGKDTGDVACDSYHKYKEDIAIVKWLGVDYYRFSIAWTRVLPDGTTNSINEAGISYYNNLIDDMLSKGIKPMVTLYHWDLPQALQNHDGWKNESVIDQFTDYANLCFDRFGDRVKMWITFNEPFVSSWLGYGIGVFAPGIVEKAEGTYVVTHNIIKSHVAAYHLYNDRFRDHQQGKVGITLDCDWKEPKTNSAADVAAANRAIHFKLGWFANPIFADGDYPKVMREFVARKSAGQGLPRSRLPKFTAAEIAKNRGSADFFGLNHYTTQYINYQDLGSGDPSYTNDQDLVESRDPTWPDSHSSWLKVVPWGIRKLSVWIRDHYNSPLMYITENGVSDGGCHEDHSRVSYFRGYINELLKAIRHDQCNIRGYVGWSLMDNLEWLAGYADKFGLFHVDFANPARPRTPKDSARYFKRIIHNNGFNADDELFLPQIANEKYAYYNGSFPGNFKFGVSSTAYEIEGAWNKDGKGPSIWDKAALANKIVNDGFTADDSYDDYKLDVKAAKEIGVNFYRFTLAWSRILPNGRIESINHAGIRYYNNLINELARNNMEPVVGLYAFDLPQALQDIGGWQNGTVAGYFRDYARLCLSTFGDRVKRWITLNSPSEQAIQGYGNNIHPPFANDPSNAVYVAAHNMIRAHVLTYRMFEKKFKTPQQSTMGISLLTYWFEPETSYVRDHYSADRAIQFHVGWFAQPIFGNGDYPTTMKIEVEHRSKDAGIAISRLPSFSQEEIAMNKGAADFMGINHYTTKYAKHKEQTHVSISYYDVEEAAFHSDLCWESTGADWLKAVPWGIRKILTWIKDKYRNPHVIITENGIADTGGIDDSKRSDYIRSTTNEVLKAVNLDGCHVSGYSYATLLDGAHWTSGKAVKFGLYGVDDQMQRQARNSVGHYRKLIRDRRL